MLGEGREGGAKEDAGRGTEGEGEGGPGKGPCWRARWCAVMDRSHAIKSIASGWGEGWRLWGTLLIGYALGECTDSGETAPAETHADSRPMRRNSWERLAG